MKTKRTPLNLASNSKFRLAVVVFITALIGSLLLAVTRAVTPVASFEAELASVSGAAVVSDANASGGQAVQFRATGTTLNAYFGSAHMHTGCCNDHGQDTATVNDIFSTAKANGFNFIFLTEHSGNTGPESQGLNRDTFYNDVKARAAQHTDNSTFVGMEGAEFSDNDTCGGIKEDHMTSVGTDTFPDPDGCSSNGATLMDYVYQQRQAGRQAFVGFNHPGSGGHAAATADKLTANRRQVTVMSEVMNGVSDGEGTDNGNYQGFVRMLDTGWRIGAVCGIDGHGLFRINTPPEAPGKNICRTGVLMPSISRANMDEAFMSRRTYATRDANIQIRYKVNGSWMGSTVGTPATLNFDIQITDPDTGNAADRISKVEIMTSGGSSGTVAQSQTFSTHNVSWQASVPANGKKYFFLRVYNGERTSFTAVSSPVWLE